MRLLSGKKGPFFGREKVLSSFSVKNGITSLKAGITGRTEISVTPGTFCAGRVRSQLLEELWYSFLVLVGLKTKPLKPKDRSHPFHPRKSSLPDFVTRLTGATVDTPLNLYLYSSYRLNPVKLLFHSTFKPKPQFSYQNFTKTFSSRMVWAYANRPIRIHPDTGPITVPKNETLCRPVTLFHNPLIKSIRYKTEEISSTDLKMSRRNTKSRSKTNSTALRTQSYTRSRRTSNMDKIHLPFCLRGKILRANKKETKK